MKIGEAVVTGAGNVKTAKYIIHAVLPAWRGVNNELERPMNNGFCCLG